MRRRYWLLKYEKKVNNEEEDLGARKVFRRKSVVFSAVEATTGGAVDESFVSTAAAAAPAHTVFKNNGKVCKYFARKRFKFITIQPTPSHDYFYANFLPPLHFAFSCTVYCCDGDVTIVRLASLTSSFVSVVCSNKFLFRCLPAVYAVGRSV